MPHCPWCLLCPTVHGALLEEDEEEGHSGQGAQGAQGALLAHDAYLKKKKKYLQYECLIIKFFFSDFTFYLKFSDEFKNNLPVKIFVLERLNI